MGAIVKSAAFSANFPKGSVSFKETGFGRRRSLTLTFKDAVLPVVDNAGVGGQVANKILDLPAEMIVFGAMRVNMTFARYSGTTTSLSDTFDGDIGIGSTTGIGATLATTEQDVFQTQSIPQAVAGVATAKLVQAATATPYDATTATSLFLNVLVDDADQDGSVTAATMKLDGTIVIEYEVLGA